MAQRSKAAKRMSRARRGMSLKQQEYNGRMAQMQEYVKDSHNRYKRLTLTLFAVLAQSGSAVEVTKGTFDQVLESLNNLSWTAEEGLEGSTVVRLVDTTPRAMAVDAGAEDAWVVERDNSYNVTNGETEVGG